MKIIVRTAATLCFLLAIVARAFAAEGNDAQKTLSPYFVVLSEGTNEEALPLEGTNVEVKIAGLIADVHVKQRYRNRGASPLEAIYVFPASTRAAVYDLAMTVGDRVIRAKVKERAQAKAEYQQAKKEGKSASLLEQQRPNVFQMNVANIMPGDTIDIDLAYTEAVVPEEGVYEFVFPEVVGPRYSNSAAQTAPSSERWVANPYLKDGTPPVSTFSITTHLSSANAIKEVTSSSHIVRVAFQNQSEADITLAPGDADAGRKDYVLRYRLAGTEIESGVMLYEDPSGEKFFLVSAEPPTRPETSAIVPREYIFVVDVSGSMNGFPLEVSKNLLRELIGSLRPTDRFNVVLFAGASAQMAPQSIDATPENIQTALSLIDAQQGGGGTELIRALTTALAIPRDEAFSRSIVVVTDGYIDFERKSFELIRNNIGRANLFAFGIGSSVNRHLIEGIAKAGLGEPFVVLNREEAPAIARRFRAYIDSPVLSDVRVEYRGLDVVDVEPKALPDLFARRPIVQFGKWRGAPGGKVIVRGRRGGEEYSQEIDLGSVRPQPSHGALKYLWARTRLAELDDSGRFGDSNELREEIVRLGLAYNLLTRFTSFIAVDDVVRTNDPARQVTQPSSLPVGVGNLAVGGELPGVPEPETWMLLVVLSLLPAIVIVGRRVRVEA